MDNVFSITKHDHGKREISIKNVFQSNFNQTLQRPKPASQASSMQTHVSSYIFNIEQNNRVV